MAKGNKPSYNDIIFDSDEEIEFYMWLEEAVKYGFVKSFSYNDVAYDLSPKQTITVEKKLKTKTKMVEKFLLHPHVYTPDFTIVADHRWALLNDPLDKISENYVIDIKGSFNKHGGDKNFSINQKWMYEKHAIFVNKVIPLKFFAATWCPEKCKLTPKTKKPRTKYTNIPTLLEKFGA